MADCRRRSIRDDAEDEGDEKNKGCTVLAALGDNWDALLYGRAGDLLRETCKRRFPFIILRFDLIAAVKKKPNNRLLSSRLLFR